MAAQKVILFYSNDTKNIRWIELDKNYQFASTVVDGDLESAAKAIGNREVILAFPGEDVLLRDATIPKTSAARSNVLIANSLEDDLVEDIEDLHFVVAKKEKLDGYSVAVVKKEKLQRCLNILLEAKIQPDFVVPEQLLLSIHNGHWSLLIEERMAMLRTGKMSGCKATIPEIAMLIPSLLSTQDKSPTVDYSGSNASGLIQDQLSVQAAPLLFHPDKKDIVDWIEINETLLNEFNMLTGYQQPGFKNNQRFKNYYVAASLFIVSAMLLVSAEIFQNINLSKQDGVLREQISSTFQSAFPGVKRIVDPMIQARQEVGKHSANNSGGNFLDLFYRLGLVVKNDKTLRIKTLQYLRGNLTINLEAQSIAQVESLRVRLEQNPRVRVEVLSTTNNNNKTQAKLRISRDNS